MITIPYDTHMLVQVGGRGHPMGRSVACPKPQHLPFQAGHAPTPTFHMLARQAASIYVQKTVAIFAESPETPKRVALHHDGASFSGEDTLVNICYVPSKDLVFYLPFQVVRRLPVVSDADLTDKVISLCQSCTSLLLTTQPMRNEIGPVMYDLIPVGVQSATTLCNNFEV